MSPAGPCPQPPAPCRVLSSPSPHPAVAPSPPLTCSGPTCDITCTTLRLRGERGVSIQHRDGAVPSVGQGGAEDWERV